MKNIYYLLLLSLLLYSSSCKKVDTTPTVVTPTPAPTLTAAFSISNESPFMRTEISFTNSSTNAVSYLWDFGDGISSTQGSPTHIYIYAGKCKSFLSHVSIINQLFIWNNHIILKTIAPFRF